MLEIVDFLNSIIWSPVLVGLCLCAGLLFSIRTRFVQLRMIPEMWRLLFQKKEDEIGLSSFQALGAGLSRLLGLVNLEFHLIGRRTTQVVTCLHRTFEA